jgi:hypothetical protein
MAYAIALGLPLTPSLLGFLLIQNSLVAGVAGYLFWRYGLGDRNDRPPNGSCRAGPHRLRHGKAVLDIAAQ